MAPEITAGPDGFYSLCVFNAENCSDDEVHSEFGKFGEIMKINRSSNIVFLRYQTLEEASNCYEFMQGHPKFNVRPAKSKAGSANSGRFREQGRAGEMNRNDNFRARRPDSGGSGDSGRTFGGCGARGGPPKLIPFPSTAAKEEGPAKQLPVAKMVVIGNLDPKMGQDTVYSLCAKSKAPPLHVAMKTLKRPPYPNISYAYVYVRNDEAVTNLVTCLNNLKLNGYRLVVCNADRLREEGKVLLNAN